RAIGFCDIDRQVCIVASDSGDPVHTMFHEVAHGIDHLLQVSAGREWRNLWRHELDAGRVPRFTRQQVDPSEFFAESCALLWSPTEYPNRAAAAFIRRLET